MEDPQQTTSKKRKGRGQTTIFEMATKRRKGQKLTVQFNSKRQLMDDAIKMESTVGCLVGSIVPISIKTWKEVGNE